MQKIQKPLLFGRFKAGALSTVVFLLLGLLFSAVLLKKEQPSGLYFPLLLVSAGISGIVGGVAATRKERKNGLINGALAAVLPCALYLIAATIMQKKFEIGSLLPCLVLLVGSVTAGIAAANRKTKLKIKKRK